MSTNTLRETKIKMPVLFIGTGSPMNAIEENSYTLAWKNIARSIEKPEAILVISAKWLTEGTGITAMAFPETIHDIGEGFPDELFETQYPAFGSPQLARKIKERIKRTDIILVENQWGLDHGAWSVLKQMYPEADIPVLQLSIDMKKPEVYHFELAKELAYLREEGVLILATGHIVHNYSKGDFYNPSGAYNWARNFDEFVKEKVLEGNNEALVNYRVEGQDADLAVPNPEQYYPLLYALGARDDKDKVSFPVEDIIFGSLSMRSIIFNN
jgi:4,5-DOPA dioxygenase extradiol